MIKSSKLMGAKMKHIKKIILSICITMLVILSLGDYGKAEEPSPVPSYTLDTLTVEIISLPKLETKSVQIIESEIEAEIIVPPTTQELFAKYFPKEDYDKTLDVLAKLLYGEARGVYEKSRTNCAAVVWCVFNRVDKGHRGNTPIECATSSSQFTGYSRRNPIKDHLRELVVDVMGRWLREKEGEIDVGRVLDPEYIFFTGSGGWNRFRKSGGGKKFTPKHSDVYGD
jgi:hypothetical protein